MKKTDLLFNVLLVPVDVGMLLLAYVFAYFLRAQYDVIYLIALEKYYNFIFLILPLIILVFVLEGLYAIRSARRGLDELAGIFVGVSFGTLLVTAAIFLTRTDIGSRVLLFYAYIFSLILVFLGRRLIRELQRYLYLYRIGVTRLIVIGSNKVAADLVDSINATARSGYQYLGFILPDSHLVTNLLSKKLGSFEDLKKLIKKFNPDEVIAIQSQLSDQKLLELIQLAQEKRFNLQLVPDLLGTQTTNIIYQTIAGIPMIEIRRTALEGWGKVIKRVIDLIGSIFGIIIFSPIMITAALAIKLTAKGPIIYKNERVGQDQKRIYAYKFRTMKIEYCTGKAYGGEQALEFEKELIKTQNTRKGALYKITSDPRLIAIGQFLRTSSIDELPQLFNSLFGTMSLVGPRPHQPREVAKYKPWQEKLFTIKPGITGLAQISGRSDLNFDDEARLDISYIENWSLWLDLKIILKTPLALIASRKRKAA